MKIFSTIMILCATLIFSCQSSKKESKEGVNTIDVEALKGAVIDIHDEVMPKMGQLMSLKKALTDKISELEGDEQNKEKISQLEEAANNLENSHEQMMQWMRQFEPDMDDMVQQEIVSYLEDQKEKIKTVGEMTNASIKKAQELLAEE